MKMKRIAIILIVFFACTGWLVASGKGGHHIRIKIKGLRDTICYLGCYYGDKQYLRDSARVDSKGSFDFKGDEPLPGGIYLVVLPGRKYFEILIDNEQHFSIETDTSEYFGHMKVRNSDDIKLFASYQFFVSEKSREADILHKSLKEAKTKADSDLVRVKMSETDKEVNAYRNKFAGEYPGSFLTKIFRAMPDPEIPAPPLLPDGNPDSSFRFHYFKTHYFDNIDFSDDRLLRTPILHKKLKNYFTNLIVPVPDSVCMEADSLVARARANREVFKFVVWYITNTYEHSNVMGMDAVFVHMAKKYYMAEGEILADSVALYKISHRAKVLEPLLIGKIAPDLTMTDSSGIKHSLLAAKAKYTILCFWDPDCGHCQKIIPKLDSLYREIKANGVEVFAVCTEAETEKWKKYIREHNLGWINVSDPSFSTNFRGVYDISSTPVFYLLDEKKEIIAKKISVEQIGEMLGKTFKRK